MGRKVIITIAPTGNVPTKEMTPYVPVTPQEIADQVYACWQEGAALAHMHARNAQGLPTSDVEVYREILACLAAKPDCDIITQLSTGGRGGNSALDRGQMICLGPEMASLSTGSSNFPAQGNINDPDTISHLNGEMVKYGVKPELEAFDTAMIPNAIYLARKGTLTPPLHFNLVLGVPGSLPATFKNLFFMYENLPEGCTWTITAIGRLQVELSAMALALGGHIRTGIEDNVYFDYEKRTHGTNVDFVRRIKSMILSMGYEVATPAEARVILGLSPKM